MRLFIGQACRSLSLPFSLRFHFSPMSSGAPASVPLPRTTVNGGSTRNKLPVWPIDASAPSVQTPLLAKCARHNREGEICCQELKGEDERQLIDPDVVRDV
jgi:vacuolar iron transporter family protein